MLFASKIPETRVNIKEMSKVFTSSWSGSNLQLELFPWERVIDFKMKFPGKFSGITEAY